MESGTGDSHDSDDSDGEAMSYDVCDVLARVRDEAATDPPAPALEEGEDAPESLGADRGLSLPPVPSTLDDRLPDLPRGRPDDPRQAKGDLDFENDIASRLAKLARDDALALPSAPSFQPSESHSALRAWKKTRYTDEDQKTWCVVCLEDATIRCSGCDDDVYCARCWKAMHVGPSAGYDERGHQWVQLERK